MDTIHENIKLMKLAQIEHLSLYSTNLCYNNRLRDLNSILKYYYKHGNFKNLNKCGELTNKQLVLLCQKYATSLPMKPKLKTSHNPTKVDVKLNSTLTNETDWPDTDPFLLQIDSLNQKQKIILDHQIFSRFESLSFKSKKTLTLHLGSVTIDSIRSHKLINGFELKKYWAVGNITVEEIDKFICDVKHLLRDIEHVNDLDLYRDNLLETISPEQLSTLRFFSELKVIYQSERLPIFKILNILINNKKILSPRDQIILKAGFHYFNNNQKLILSDLSRQYKVNRERIRQIRSDLSNLSSRFYFLKQLKSDDILLYDLDLSASYIVVDNAVESKFNNAENTGFSYIFIAKILSIILSDKYIYLSSNPKFDFCHKSKVQKIQNTYLISRTIADEFNFDEFLIELKERLSKKILKEYSVNLKRFLLKFLKNDSASLNNETIQIAELLLLKEFNLTIENGNIIFKRNTLKKVIEYIIEALEKSPEPISINDLFEIINRDKCITKTVISLKGMCYNDNRIISLQRGTMFALQKWGIDRNIKVGSILDMVYDYLQQKTIPIHFRDLVEHISIVRPTTNDSLYVNMKHDSKKRFTYFVGGFWGLASKKYPEEFIELVRHPKSKNIDNQRVKTLIPAKG